MVRSSLALCVLSLLSMLASSGQTLRAAEGAVGFYLLGSKGSMAGVVPPPGTYVQNIKYYYSGNTSGTLDAFGLTIGGGVQADAFYDLPVGLWVAPKEVLGGNLAFTLITPIGWKDVSAGLISADLVGLWCLPDCKVMTLHLEIQFLALCLVGTQAIGIGTLE